MKSINTKYDGHYFRSRIEARWAVFFKTLGIKYEYEKETYDLDGVLYCPDFFIPELDVWIEIKGKDPTGIEINKARKLAEKSKKDVYIFFGTIPYPCLDGSYGIGDDSAFKINKGFDSPYWWCICEPCKLIGIEFEGRSARLKECKCGGDKNNTFDHPILKKAYAKAREQRFF